MLRHVVDLISVLSLAASAGTRKIAQMRIFYVLLPPQFFFFFNLQITLSR